MANGSTTEKTSTEDGTSSQAVFPVIDHNHPLFLQHTDTPGISLIFLQLIGSENYALWSRPFRIGLGTIYVADYHSMLRDLWDEYDPLMPCRSCPCPEPKKFGEHYDYQRLLQFLIGLNESYSTPRSQILMMSTIPTLNKAYALLIDQESQRNLASSASNSSGVTEGTTTYTHRSNT
ncbi:uncharacterized protein LOC125838645 [Solanum verrucosum]|uniref:uncharacterized protein LOC125838645 n=1 Tax=Solanum verrucosum TaxID=315347 RepID=UPI0020D19119|nr:uncharacterized protein LOC125838645 [Solanum verrucosum]